MRHLIFALITGLCLVVVGCEAEEENVTCQTGATQTCICDEPIKALGAQKCDEDGNWPECTCGGGGLDAGSDDTETGSEDTDGADTETGSEDTDDADTETGTEDTDDDDTETGTEDSDAGTDADSGL